MIGVTAVDPHDDSLWRWVLQHYRFDPERNQRRWVVVAAYDNEAEFEASLAAHSRQLRDGIDNGDRDGQEQVGGVLWHPGYHAEQARGRLAGEAARHGVDPRPLLQDGPLPANVAVFGWDADGQAFALGGDEPPSPPAD